jgi:tetratricopeptide (TPR) repeat protein
MKKNKKSYLFGALAIILAIIWLYPKAAGQFYLFRGERSIDLVIENVYGADKNAIACTLPPVEDPDDRAPLRTAIADLTKSVDQNPALDHAYILLGRAYCYLGEIDNAVVMYQQYVSQRPNNPLGHLELGFSLERLPDQEQAVAHWKKAGLTAEDFERRAQRARQLNKIDDALDWYRRSSWIDPERAEPWIGIGKLLEEIQDYDGALEAYKVAYAVNPEASVLSLANRYYQQGQYDEAAGLLQTALDRYLGSNDRLQWWLLLGDIRRAAGDWDSAVELYTDALTEFPNDIDLHISMGWSYYEVDRNTELALEHFERAIELNPDSNKGYYAIATLLNREERFNEAEKWYAETVAREPVTTWQILMQGNNLRSAGKILQAIEVYQTIIETKPRYDWAHFEIALANYYLGEYESASEAIVTAISYSASPSQHYYNRAGRIFEQLGDFETAIAYYQKALELNPNLSSARDGLNRIADGEHQ